MSGIQNNLYYLHFYILSFSANYLYQRINEQFRRNITRMGDKAILFFYIVYITLVMYFMVQSNHLEAIQMRWWLQIIESLQVCRYHHNQQPVTSELFKTMHGEFMLRFFILARCKISKNVCDLKSATSYILLFAQPVHVPSCGRRRLYNLLTEWEKATFYCHIGMQCPRTTLGIWPYYNANMANMVYMTINIINNNL